MQPFKTGALKSKFDIRTFSAPTKEYPNIKGGERYLPEDIENQHNVGICTAISLTQNAKKATGIKYSADFQYLIQKKYVDGNWYEGSSILSALKAARGKEDSNGNFLYGGLLPADKWTFTTEDDRRLPYSEYIKKLQAIPEIEIRKLFWISKNYRIRAYASVPVSRDAMAKAIDESKSGILSRYDIGKEWWTDLMGNISWSKYDLQPLRAPKTIISGHAVTDSNYNGNSFRVANSWGKEWAEGGTAYRYKSYSPTECWLVYYEDVPKEIEDKVKERETLKGQILDLLQKVLELLLRL